LDLRRCFAVDIALSKTREPERLLWCDLARVLAATLVLLIHVSAKWFENYGRIPAFDWQLANILDSAARLSVPWFFMLSGFLLFERKPARFADYMRRRLTRVLGPFLLFSVIGVLVASTIGPKPPSWNVLLDPAYYHLWFFQPLLVFYLIAYFITPAKTNPWLAIGMCYALIAVTGGSLANLQISGLAVRSEQTFAYVLYGLAGHYAAQVPLRRWTGPACLVVLVVSVALLALGTNSLSGSTGFGNEWLFTYVSLPVATAAIAGFIWIRSLGLALSGSMPPALESVLTWLSGYSLAVYGLHAFILAVIWNAAGSNLLKLGAPVGIPLLVACIGALSMIAALIGSAIDRRGLLLGTPNIISLNQSYKRHS
jgi:surface polysaccharide O-acyltransferase-like enzyme